MKTYSAAELAAVLESHRKYLANEPGGDRADLRDADLHGADLRDADLHGADLHGADLRGAKLDPLAAARTEIVPREGEVIGWKQCSGQKIVKLRVPPDAKRCNATGRKCRASHVEVLTVEKVDGTAAPDAVSMYDYRTTYRPGETVKADGWTEDRFVECGHGIHFYLTREEAVDHC